MTLDNEEKRTLIARLVRSVPYKRCMSITISISFKDVDCGIRSVFCYIFCDVYLEYFLVTTLGWGERVSLASFEASTCHVARVGRVINRIGNMNHHLRRSLLYHLI